MNIDSLEPLMKYIPLLIPILLIQLGLEIFALVDLVKTPKTRGPKWVWALIILFVNMIGPIVYLTVGRERE
jgi:hypothetical protein